MPITFVTGTPGAGKTLNTLKMVYERARDEHREVWYYGIELIRNNGVGIDFDNWHEMKKPEGADLDKDVTPLSWYLAPHGAIILIDECHKYFPRIGVTAKNPRHVMELAEHRHWGLDVYLISQGVKLVNSDIKEWIQPHIHFRRLWGGKTTWRYENEFVIENVRNIRELASTAVKDRVRLDPKWFKAYVSATVHTMQKRVPKRLIFFMLLPFVMIFFGLWGLAQYYGKRMEKTTPPVAVSSSAPGIVPMSPMPAEAGGEPVADVFDPVTAYVPRIEGMPETAPAYDELRRPQDFPRPNCLRRKKRCECYTQQGTLMRDYPRELCIANVERGYFDPTRPRTNTAADTGLRVADPQK